jgi:NTP pyrophosphatase (non-canonical NTP hydrolase)
MTREEHLLVILSEECAEVIHAVSKALRFGLNDCHPATFITNKENIEKELNDLGGIIELLRSEYILDISDPTLRFQKIERIEQYLQYSKKVGKLE